jgi:hypothetical protein
MAGARPARSLMICKQVALKEYASHFLESSAVRLVWR